MNQPAWLFCLLLLLLAGCGSPHNKSAEDAPLQQKSAEKEPLLPAFPKQENLIEFYAGEMTTNHFFIDPLSLRVDKEGVVLYTMVIKTSGGSTNISYESIRCDPRQVRLYATGRSDETWSRARVSEWRDIENKILNSQHAALSRNFFCPGSRTLNSAEEGVDALRRGRHHDVQKYEKP
ncbi:MAG: CNP1-like family protein [Sterolibacterium sp.]